MTRIYRYILFQESSKIKVLGPPVSKKSAPAEPGRGILCSQDRMPACYFPKYRYINVMICSLKQSESGLKSVSLIPVVIPSANAQATAFSK